jgi:hypothetical protein
MKNFPSNDLRSSALMVKKFSFPLFLSFFILLFSNPGRSQQITPDDNLRFRDSIHMVKVWTRIASDTAIGFYIDALNATKTVLHRKGYRVEQVFFDKRSGITPHAWEKRMIESLAPHEAFLDLLTRIIADSIHSRNTEIINEHIVSKGVPVVVYNITPEVSSDVSVKYQSFVNADFYVKWKKDTAGSFIPLFSKREELESGDIFLAVKKSLSKVPASNNPVEIPANERVAQTEKTKLEITGFAGYVFPSSMDLIASGGTATGKADFSACAHYGVDVSLGITRSIDLFVMYDREDTKFTMNTTDELNGDVLTASINHILLGASYNFRVSHVVSPYVALAFGSVNITPKDNYYRDVWYFALNPQVGVKLYLSKLIGLRFQAYAMYQVHPQNAPFLYSDYSFSNAWDSMSNMLQVGLSGGVIFRIGGSR